MANELDSGGEESPGVLSDDHEPPPDSPDSNSTDPPDNNKGFPWLKVLPSYIHVKRERNSHRFFRSSINSIVIIDYIYLHL